MAMWNLVVYPTEKSLVVFVEWVWKSVDGQGNPTGVVLGVAKYMYALSVTFEEQTYDLVQSFSILENSAC